MSQCFYNFIKVNNCWSKYKYDIWSMTKVNVHIHCLCVLVSLRMYVFCFLLLMLEKYSYPQEGELNIIFCTLQVFGTRSTSVRFEAGWESRCTPADLTYLFKLAAGVPATAGQRGGWGAWVHWGQWRISQLAHTHTRTLTERRLSPRSSP